MTISRKPTPTYLPKKDNKRERQKSAPDERNVDEDEMQFNPFVPIRRAREERVHAGFLFFPFYMVFTAVYSS